MTLFDKKSFIDFIMKNNIMGFKDPPFTLNSGRESSWYVNWRNVSENRGLLNILVDYVLCFTMDLGLKPNCFYGVPEGATKLGIITQYRWSEGSNILPMGRGKPKDHGDPKDKYFVGAPKGNVVVIEDVTTTGSSLLEEIVKIRELKDANIVAAFGLTDRMESTPNPEEKVYRRFLDAYENIIGQSGSYNGNMGVEQAFSKLGIPFYALSNARELLPEAFRRFKPNDKIVTELRKQLNNPTLSLVSYSELIGQDNLIQEEKPTGFGE